MHLFVLAMIGLLFFGPSKLPALGKSLGEAIKGFKDAMDDTGNESGTNSAVAKKAEPPRQTPHTQNETAVIVTETTAEHVTDTAATKTKTPVS